MDDVHRCQAQLAKANMLLNQSKDLQVTFADSSTECTLLKESEFASLKLQVEDLTA